MKNSCSINNFLFTRRFQKKPTSDTVTTNPSTARNVVTSSSSTNERKRAVPEITMKNEPPSKRVSISPRQTASTSNVLTNSPSSIRNKQTNEPIAKNVQQNNKSSPERLRFTPKPITGPSLQPPSSTNKTPPVALKRSLVPVTASSPTSTKTIVQVPPNTSKPTLEQQPSNSLNEEDENQLLKLNDSSDIVDTFALIDEALLEADHLLELI